MIMKKLLSLLMCGLLLLGCSDKYDDSALRNDLSDLENRVTKLEELCKQMNTNISSLQTIVTALQNNDYVTGVTPIMQNGKEVGYTITFSKGNPITIYHGKDGATPTIGVKQDTDGFYYWTLNSDWLTDAQGKKIKTEGTNGKDGITPKFKIENDYWFISYDNGTNWTQLAKATGEDGKDGEDGVGGDSMFSDVDYKTSANYVIFTLADGTEIKLPTWSAFEALQRLCNETNTNLSALQAIVTALQNNDYITSVDPLTENGKVVGYTIKFAKSNPIVIYNGKDGADGVDGTTPIISIKKDMDGIYYWTLDGEFIVVDGQKIKAQGIDGDDGSDGVTPKLEIREGYWWISYDSGTNWSQLGKAMGEDGKDADSIKITQDENNVYFELADGTVISISKTGQSVDPNVIKFEDENVKAICINNWDTDKDGELSYEEAAIVTTIGTNFSGKGIFAFNELQYFIGITSIPDNAFSMCKELLSIKLPNNIISIGKKAFYYCDSLKEIHIPANIESIGNSAFELCMQLTTITFGKGSKLNTITGSYGKSISIGIANCNGTFMACKNLATIEIPASVEVIDACAFRGCNKLTSITFEKGSRLTRLGGGYIEDFCFGCFANCSALISIDIPASVKVIDAGVFYKCTSLTDVFIESGSQLQIIEGGTDIGNVKMYYGAFSGCTVLQRFDAQNCAQVTTIGEAAFYNCNNLTLFKIGTKTPPICNNDAFSLINSNSALKTPVESVDTYKTTTGWNKFANITGLNE